MLGRLVSNALAPSGDHRWTVPAARGDPGLRDDDSPTASYWHHDLEQPYRPRDHPAGHDILFGHALPKEDRARRDGTVGPHVGDEARNRAGILAESSMVALSDHRLERVLVNVAERDVELRLCRSR